MVLAPVETFTGDVICVLGGADMPFIIRKEGYSYRAVGVCFMDDNMGGEVVHANSNW